MDIKLFIPMISVYLVGSFFPINSRTKKVIPYRPPGWIFGVVWPVLLFLIGYSWTLRPQLTNYYIALIVILSSWMISFTYNETLAFLTILTVIALSVYLIVYKYQKKSSLALVPLVLWLSFASYLSSHFIHVSESK